MLAEGSFLRSNTNTAVSMKGGLVLVKQGFGKGKKMSLKDWILLLHSKEKNPIVYLDKEVKPSHWFSKLFSCFM